MRRDTKKIDKMRTEETSASESTELRKSVIDAEEIAVAENEITEAFQSRNIPPGEWHGLFNEVLKRHPQINQYAPFFFEYLKGAIQRSQALNSLWEDALDNNGRKSNTNQVAQYVYEYIFNRTPIGEIKVTKGKQAIIIETNEQEFDALRKLDPSAASVSESGGVAGGYTLSVDIQTRLPDSTFQEVRVPVIVQPATENKSWQNVVLHHESQHAFYNMYKQSRYETMKGFQKMTDDLRLPLPIKKTAERGEHSGIEEAAKDEVLALINGWLYVHEHNNKLDEGLKSDYFKNVLEELATGHYKDSYVRHFKDREAFDQQEYSRRISNALRSALFLTKLYSHKYQGKGTVMAVNVLRSFPIKNWPGVVKLIERRGGTEVLHS